MKNSKRIKATTLLFLLVTAGILFSGCTTFDNFKNTFIDKKLDEKDKKTIYIGVYEPMSGEFEKQGRDEIKGIALANEIYSNVKGVEIKLVYVDNQSDVNTSRTVIQNLIKMEPIAIIGSAGEAPSMIASPYIEKAKIPTITASATNPLITEDNPYYFRACITDSQHGSGLAEYAYMKLDSRKVGIVTIKNDSSVAAFAEGFRDKLTALAEEDAAENPIAFRTSLDVNDESMKNLVEKIKKSKADVVFLPLGAEKANVLFRKIEKAGLQDKVTFLGLQTWNSDEFVAMMKKHPEIRIAFPSDTVAGEDTTTTGTVTAETQRFLIEYAAKYGDNEIPSENAALGYDSYLLLVNAINNAESFHPKAVRTALTKIDALRCATGVFTFDEGGTPIRSVNISTIDRGKVISLYVTSGTSAAETMKKIEQ